MPELRRTVCNRDCPDACAVVAQVENQRIVSLRGDPNHPVTQGFLCYRTSHFLQTHYSADRLTSPLVRRGDDFVPIPWEDALGLAAQKLTHIRDSSGPAAILHYRSGGSLGLLKLLTDYFFEKFGPVTTKRGDICSGAGDAAQMLDFGEEDSNDIFTLLESKNIILWGKNVHTSSPHLLPILKSARSSGARLMLIDPIQHRGAQFCDTYYNIAPGGDFAFAMATARVLFEQSWTDPSASTYCDHWEEFQQLCFSKGVEQWCQQADMPVSAAIDVARRLGAEKPTAILVGWGMARRRNGGQIVRALDALGAISGNVGIAGGGVSFYYKRRGAFDTSIVQELAPRTLCEPLLGQEIFAANNPPIRAVWVTAANPVAMLADSKKVAQSIRSREFVVVVDNFLTDTARQAHLVLPTTTLLEEDDLLGAYGHHYLSASRPVVAPPAGVRSDLQIMQELARRVGLGALLDGDTTYWKNFFIRKKHAGVELRLSDLECGAVRNPLPPKVLFADRVFSTPSGRVNLLTTAGPPTPAMDRDFPLILHALSTPDSQSSQWVENPDGPLWLRVHPQSAAGIADGVVCEVESRLGSLRVLLQHDNHLRPDVALMPKGGHFTKGQSANALVQAVLTDLGEGAAYYEERVRLRAVSS